MVDSIYNRRFGGLDIPALSQSTASEQFSKNVEAASLRTAAELEKNAEDIYQMDFKISAHRLISDIFSKNPNDPDALRQEFDEAQKGLLKDASPEQALRLQAGFEMLAMPHMAKATQNRINIQNNEVREKSLTALQQIQMDLEHRAADMLNNNAMVADEASRAAQYNFLSLEEELGRTDSQGNPLYTPDQKVKIRNNLRQNSMYYGVQRYISESENPAAAWREISEGKKKFRFYDENGNVSLELDPRNDMDLNTYIKLERFAESRAKEIARNVKENEDEQRIRDSLAGSGYVIDPNDPADKKGLNAVFIKDFLPTIQGHPPALQAQETIQWVEHAGAVPSALKSRLSATIVNGTPQQQEYAAYVVNGIASKRPQALAGFSDKDITYANSLYSMVSDGIPVEQAIERLERTFDPRQADLVSKRKKEAEEALKIKKPAFIIGSALKKESGNWFFDPSITPEQDVSDRLVTRFNRAFKEEYILTGNADLAEKRATQRIRSNTGISNIGVGGGKGIMLHPPIKYYEIEGLDNAAWLEKDFKTFVEENIPDKSTSTVFLGVDDQTESEIPSLRPTYPVMYKDDSGAIVPFLDEDGSWVRYQPDVQRAINEHNQAVRRQSEMNVMESKYLEAIQKGEKPEDEGFTWYVKKGVWDISQSLKEASDAVKKGYKEYKKQTREFDWMGIDG